jgi:hypothetical protein
MSGASEKSGQGPEGAGAHRPSDAVSAPAGAASRPIPCLDDCGAEASPIKLVVMVGFHHRFDFRNVDDGAGVTHANTPSAHAHARPRTPTHAHARPRTIITRMRRPSKGHQVEWAFPTPASSPLDFRHLAMLCLPEGAHNVDGLGHVFFSVELALTPNEPRQVLPCLCPRLLQILRARAMHRARVHASPRSRRA